MKFPHCAFLIRMPRSVLKPLFAVLTKLIRFTYIGTTCAQCAYIIIKFILGKPLIRCYVQTFSFRKLFAIYLACKYSSRYLISIRNLHLPNVKLHVLQFVEIIMMDPYVMLLAKPQSFFFFACSLKSIHSSIQS